MIRIFSFGLIIKFFLTLTVWVSKQWIAIRMYELKHPLIMGIKGGCDYLFDLFEVKMEIPIRLNYNKQIMEYIEV